MFGTLEFNKLSEELNIKEAPMEMMAGLYKRSSLDWLQIWGMNPDVISQYSKPKEKRTQPQAGGSKKKARIVDSDIEDMDVDS